MQTEKILVHAPPGVPSRLLVEYVSRCRSALPDLQTALDQSDHGQMRVFGHRLRGTGGAYGFPPLTEIGSLIEQASSSGDIAELRRHVAALEAYLSRIEIVSD